MNLASRQAQSAPLSKEQRFSESRAIQLCSNVVAMESQTSFINEAKLGEALRDLAEVLVYNDKHNETVVDKILMERDLMSTLERLVTNAMNPISVKINVLQCVTMLLQNLARVSSVYFLCSNNRINRMIAIPFDEDDDELTSMYVSFLKSLALRLNKDTVQFFFEADTGAFPLYDRAVKVLNATEDPMVRAATRQIVVCVAQIDDAAVREFLFTGLVEVYEGAINSIVSQLAHVAKLIPSPTDATNLLAAANKFNPRAIIVRMEDVMDDVLYVNDLYNSAPAATDEKALRRVVEEVVTQPIAQIFASPPSSADEEDETRITRAVERMRAIHPSVILGFMARWAHANEIVVLHKCFRETFLSSMSKDAHGDCLLFRLADAHPTLLPPVLLLRQNLLRTKPGGGGEREVSASRDSKENVQRASASTLLQRRTWPPKWASLVNDLLDDPAKWLSHEQSNQQAGDATVAFHLVELLYSFLTELTDQAAACSLGLLLEQLESCLTNDAFNRLGVLALELCKNNVRRLVTEVYQPICDHLKSRTAHPVGNCEAVVEPREYLGSAVSDDEAEWVDSHFYTEGLGIYDGYLVAFLETRRAWELLGEGSDTHAALNGYNEKDVALLLPLLPCGKGGGISATMSSASAYKAAQESIRDAGVPLWHRAPMDRKEQERASYLVWFAAAHAFERQFPPTAGGSLRGPSAQTLCGTLDVLRAVHKEGSPFSYDCFNMDDDNILIQRCDVVEFITCETPQEDPAAEGDATKPPKVLRGTSLYFTVTDTEVLFLSEHENDSKSRARELTRGVCTRTVAVALDIAYVRAACLPEPAAYRVVVQGLFPGHERELHLVFSSGSSAAGAVKLMNAKAGQARHEAAALGRRLLSPDVLPSHLC